MAVAAHPPGDELMGYKPIPLDLVARFRDKGLSCPQITEAILKETGRRFRPESISHAMQEASQEWR